ncbi:MAG: ABC transporter substrate-binding protein [Rubrivivax sp.]|nr:ABC transporter substrate-binding protein [Rubrivivax sp.]
MRLRSVPGLIAALTLGAALLPAQAQIRVGQTAGFSGPVAAGVKETTDGAKLYLDFVNARGGVNGEKIELVSADDKFDPKLAGENARKLVADPRLVALFLTRGTPHAQAVMPVLVESKTPLIGPSTGAMVLHEPVNPYIFNVRATYQREAERAIVHLASVGMTRIAIVQVDDSFGADSATGALRGFEQAQLKPVLHAKFDRARPDFAPIAPQIVKTGAQAVLFIASGTAVADGMKAMRGAGSRAQAVTLSNNASGGFVKLLGDQARGTIVSQVFPNERSMAVPMIREAMELARAKGLSEVSPAMMEGYAAAKVLVEGLRRAGPNPTRASLLAALNGMGRYDLGGLEVGYSATDRTGLDYADLSIIGADGRFMR